MANKRKVQRSEDRIQKMVRELNKKGKITYEKPKVNRKAAEEIYKTLEDLEEESREGPKSKRRSPLLR